MTVDTLVTIPARRTGTAHLWRSYRVMVRFEVINLRLFLMLTLVIQTLMGAGMGIMYGFYLGDIPPQAQTFLVSGIPALSLFPLGFLLVPGLRAEHRLLQLPDRGARPGKLGRDCRYTR